MGWHKEVARQAASQLSGLRSTRNGGEPSSSGSGRTGSWVGKIRGAFLLGSKERLTNSGGVRGTNQGTWHGS